MISPGSCLHWKILLAFLLITVPASGQEIPDPSTQYLYFTKWESSFLSMHYQGSACWVNDDAGNLRCEIMLGQYGTFEEDLKRLLEWDSYEGWTVVSVETGGGTYSRWNEQWQELTPAWDTWLRVVVGQLSGGLALPPDVRDVSPGGRPLAQPLFVKSANRSRTKRLQIPRLSSETENLTKSFRQYMAHRGHGCGGPETVLSLEGSSSGNSRIRITSSHMPAALQMDSPQPLAVSFKSEEVFLPWWPLARTIVLE